MERRREPRLEFSGRATLKVLCAPALSSAADVLDLSGSGMRLRVANPVPCGMPVEIDCGDRMALGEVCRCQPENAGSSQGPFIAGVQISQVVASLSELQRFARRLDEFATAPVERASR